MYRRCNGTLHSMYPALKDQMVKTRPPLKGPSTSTQLLQHEVAEVMITPGSHPFSWLFGIGADRGLCVSFGVEKRQPVKATNQSLNVHVEREHCLFFVYSDLSEGWETPRLYNIITVETFCFVCVLVLNKFYAMLSPFLFSGVHLANDPDRWVKQEIWLDKNHWKHFKRTPSWRYGCFRK